MELGLRRWQHEHGTRGGENHSSVLGIDPTFALVIMSMSMVRSHSQIVRKYFRVIHAKSISGSPSQPKPEGIQKYLTIGTSFPLHDGQRGCDVSFFLQVASFGVPRRDERFESGAAMTGTERSSPMGGRGRKRLVRVFGGCVRAWRFFHRVYGVSGSLTVGSVPVSSSTSSLIPSASVSARSGSVP